MLYYSYYEHQDKNKAGMQRKGWFHNSGLSAAQVMACKFTMAIFFVSAAFCYVALSVFDAVAIAAHNPSLTESAAFVLFAAILGIVTLFSLTLLAVVIDIRRHCSIDATTKTVAEQQDPSATFSVIAHQLRSPLSAIRWLSEVLQSETKGKLNERQSGYIDDINDEARRTIRLVNNLMRVEQMESGKLGVEPVDVSVEQLLSRVARELRSQSSKSHATITIRKSKQRLPKLRTDADLLYQVFVNVIGNAVRYSKSGRGKVEISTRPLGQGQIEVEIKDQGIGIPKAYQPFVFAKFYRAPNAMKRQTDGTGLGLYISKMILERLGGTIRFTSQEHQGTTFTIELGSLS